MVACREQFALLGGLAAETGRKESTHRLEGLMWAALILPT